MLGVVRLPLAWNTHKILSNEKETKKNNTQAIYICTHTYHEPLMDANQCKYAKANIPGQTNKGESYYQRTSSGEVQWEVPVGHTVTIMYVRVLLLHIQIE